MGFIKGEGTLVGANMKKNGTLLIQIEVSGELASAGDYARLRKMMNTEVGFSLDGQVVKYDVPVNSRTQEPVITYTVDSLGMVVEFKKEGEQLELELNVPKNKEPIEHIPEEISRDVVDEFILSGLAPQPKGFYPLQSWIARLESGETYQMIAGGQGMNSGKVADLIDEYRMTCAPLAAAWDEWRQNGGAITADADDQPEEEAEDTNQADAGEADEPKTEDNSGEDIVFEDGQQQEPDQSVEDELSDWEKEILGETDKDQQQQEQEQEQANIPESEPADDLDEYILQAKPRFEDIPYDFPALLERKKNGETWLQIAKSLGTRSGLLSSAWTKYRKKVKELRNGGAA